MSNSALTIIACGLIPIAVVVGIAILGTLKRITFASNLMEEIKKGRFREWPELQHKKKIRLLLVLAMSSAAGVLAITIMVIAGILSLRSSPVLIAYIILATISLFTGAILYKRAIERMK